MTGNIAAMEAASLFGVEVVGEQAMKPMTLRVPFDQYAMLSAMATQAKTSKNAISIKVIEAGIAAVADLLPPELLREIEDQQGAYLAQLYQEHGED
jgi:hypothetical protein